MAKSQPIQTSFAFGEMSPRLLGRTTLARYKESLRVCENAITFSHGPAFKRPGTAHIEISPSEGDVRLFSLQADPANPFVVELGWRAATGGYVRLLNRSGYLLAATQYIDNHSFNTSLVGWADESDNNAGTAWDARGYALFFPSTQGGGRSAILRQQITVDNPGDNHRFNALLYTDSLLAPLTVNVGTAPGASDIFTVDFAVGQSIAANFVPGTATFWLDLVVDGAFSDDTIALDHIVLYESAAPLFEVPTPWDEADLERISVAESTQQLALYFALTKHPTYRLIIPASGVVVFEQVPFVNAPIEWVAGSYPGAVTFFQQRLWLAGTVNEPDTLWGSQINDFLDFDVGTGDPTDAIAFEMSDRGVIEWIQGSKNLLVGTDVSEYLLTSVEGVITPGDIQVQQQSAYGGAHQNSQEYANGVLYLGSDRRRIRFMQYQFLEDAWTSMDITWPSEHVTVSGVRELHFKYSPDPLLWCVMRDGTAVSAMYEEQERGKGNLVGWHRHPMPEGFVRSCALTKRGPATEVWFAMKRTIDGVDVTYIERSEAAEFDAAVGGVTPSIYMDSTILSTVTVSGDDLIVAGLEVLEGQEVDSIIGPLAGTAGVHIPRTVVGGQITVQEGFAKAGDFAVVGVGYVGRLLTLPLEGINPSGTAQALMKRRNRIFLRLLNSALPVVNGIETGARFPVTPMNERQPQFTGDLQVTNLGWDRFAEVEVLMPKPLSYTVLAIFGDAEGNVP